MNVLLLELAALPIIACYVLFRALSDPRPRQFLIRLLLIVAAGWIAEESAVMLFGFYEYNPCWNLFLLHVPITVILVWPAVVHSAWDLASQLKIERKRFVPLATAAIVFTDASLIEPIAVNAGLWVWHQPGLFGVPPVGIFGWAFFAFFCTRGMEKEHSRTGWTHHGLISLLVPVVGTHLLLFVTWWSALRWINRPVDPKVGIILVWALSFLLVSIIIRRKPGAWVEKKTLLLRLPATLLVFTLLALNIGPAGELLLYTLAFVPPYLTLMAQQYLKVPSKKALI